MNEIINDLVAALKEEAVYQSYIASKKALEEHASLLLDFKKKKEEYLKMKPLFKYQNFTVLKTEVENLAQQVSSLSEYQSYKQASLQLEARLDELSEMIFAGIYEKPEVTSCVSLQENIKKEI